MQKLTDSKTKTKVLISQPANAYLQNQPPNQSKTNFKFLDISRNTKIIILIFHQKLN